MLKIRKPLLIPLLVGAFFSADTQIANAKEIVLQHGLNEYSGTDDTSLDRLGFSDVWGEFTNGSVIHQMCPT